MDRLLQLILIIVTFAFTVVIIKMINKRKLQLNYTLMWIITAIVFFIILIFPGVIDFISKTLHIIEPVNALFSIIIFFLMLIIFSLTKTISGYSNKVKDLTQELGLLKNSLDKLYKD